MNFPEPFIVQVKELLKNEFPAFLDALHTTPPISIRVNDKIHLQPSAERVAWCNTGYYLPKRPLFTLDPLLHAGAYYVQEASSMFLQQALEQHVPPAATVLDLCAAPGGKSTLISQYVNKNGLLVCNEVVRNRAHILAENMMKWGNENVVVSHNASKDFERLPSFFDAIVVDAPCSGEGMFRKDAEAIGEWSELNVLMCAARQKVILSDVWNALKTGGVLIYSTCTFNAKENEENIQWIENELGAEFLPLDVTDFPQITVSGKGYRFFPHKVRGEGFFVAALRKTSENSQKLAEKQKKISKNEVKNRVASSKDVDNLKHQLIHSEKWKIYQENNFISAFDKTKSGALEVLKSNLKLLHFGITLAEQKGKDFIPHTSLALSKNIQADNFQHADIDLDTTLHYLKKETIDLPDSKKGYILLKYKSAPIGWVKNIGNRCNNLYPHEWRIRMNLPMNTGE